MSDPHEADASAMERLRLGEHLALNELMSRWQQPLLNYLYRLSGCQATAQDLAQETFVRVYEARGRYDQRGRFSTWLYTIAANLAKNRHRWQERHPAVSLEATSGDDTTTLGDQIPDPALSPAQSAEDNERAAAVRQVIAELPEEQRSLVVLSEFEGQTHVEIGKIHGCSPKAVETRLYRIRQSLREKLAPWLK